ncbi:MAG TPA: tRNA lysidine(34) synthetase TilS [Thermoanaerobaculia bacterium]|nr:tRNA lysidine(34) synthetase TilS [Thermoanaerobaculia bacterium]
MPLQHAVRAFFAERTITPRHLLVAASGGPDSTALLLTLAEWPERPFPITAAHVNHRLRGAESDADEAFLRSTCERLRVPLIVLPGTLDAAAVRESGIEAAARESRYAALRACRDAQGFDFIATAHQQHDQAETILIRLLTGTGPGRLAGIPAATRDGIVRPLLEVPREEIERFLRDRGIEMRHDRMNRDPRFLRTRVREEILPLLEQFNPRIVSSLAETAKQSREQQDAVRWMIGALSDRWVRRTADSAAFDAADLPENPWIRRAVLLREIQRLEPGAREVSSADLERLALALPSLRRTSVTKQLELVREGTAIVLRARASAAEPWERTIEPGERVNLPGGRVLRLERLGVSPPETEGSRGGRRMTQRFQLPEESRERSFVVRNRRRGDRFRPLGSPHEKKIGELLIDRKIPRDQRDRIPLLIWNGAIVWIAGVEISDDFKVTEPWRETFEASIDGNND